MNRPMALAALLAFSGGFVPGAAQQVVDFEGATVCPTSGVALPTNGYQGFNWSNFWIANRTSFAGTGADNGFDNCVGYNGGGNLAQMLSGNPFILNSGYFTAGWATSLTVTLEGWRNGSLLWAESFNVGKSAYTQWFVTDYRWVDEVRFSGSNAVGDTRTHIVMDNLGVTPMDVTATPEPATVALLLTGLTGIGFVARRKRKAGMEA